jgi:hypothetical protein
MLTLVKKALRSMLSKRTSLKSKTLRAYLDITLSQTDCVVNPASGLEVVCLDGGWVGFKSIS